MKATKKQLEEVKAMAIEMNFSTDLAIKTLQNCSLSIYKAIGAKGVVESSIRTNSKNFVDTLELAKKANRMDVSIESLMTPEQRGANWCK